MKKKDFDDILKRVSELPEKPREDFEKVMKGERLPSLTADVIAKHVFSPDLHADRAEYLLRAITGDHSITVEGSFANEGMLLNQNSKHMFFDIPITLSDLRRADIEFQVVAQKFIMNRCDLYSSNMLLLQYSAAKGQKKSKISVQDVKEVIIICLMAETPREFKELKTDDYIHAITKWKSDSGLTFPSLRKIYFVELEKALRQFKEGIDIYGNPELLETLALIADSNDEKALNAAKENVMLTDIIKDASVFVKDKGVLTMLLANELDYWTENAIAENAKAEGKAETVYSFVQDGDITPSRGAEKLGITVEQLRFAMKEAGYSMPD